MFWVTRVSSLHKQPYWVEDDLSAIPGPFSLQGLDDLSPHQQGFVITVTIPRVPERGSFLGLQRCLNGSSPFVESGDRQVIYSEAPLVVFHGAKRAVQYPSSKLHSALLLTLDRS